MSEITAEAHRLWKNAGLLSDSVVFKATVQNNVLILMVDAHGVGRKQSMMVRCSRPILLPCSDLKTVIDELYRSVMQSMAESAGIGVKF